MKIIAMASSKGGTGKSTLSCAIAVHATQEGASVLMIDLDPQRSSEAWWYRAGSPNNPMLALGAPKASETVKMIDRHGLNPDYLIVDLPGSMVDVIQDAVSIANAVVVVSQPSPKDLEGQGTLEDIINKFRARAQTLYVLNRVDNRSKLIFEAQMLLASRGVHLPLLITERVSYVRADNEGRTAPSIDKLAAAEIAALWKSIKGIADDHHSKASAAAVGSDEKPDGQSAGAQPARGRGIRLSGLAKQGA